MAWLEGGYGTVIYTYAPHSEGDIENTDDTTPEPATLALMCPAALGLLLYLRRRR